MNNQNNNNPYAYTPNAYDPTSVTPNNVGIQDSSNSVPEIDNATAMEFVKTLISQNVERSNNLTEQGKIINQKHQENVVLTKENEDLRKSIAELTKQVEELKNNTFSYGDSNLQNQVATLQNAMNAMQQREKEQQLLPIVECIQNEFGLKTSDVEPIFNRIYDTYGVDMKTTPNINLVRHFIQTEYLPPIEPSVPNGGYTNYQPANQISQQTSYELKLAAAKQRIADRKNKNKNENYW